MYAQRAVSTLSRRAVSARPAINTAIRSFSASSQSRIQLTTQSGKPVKSFSEIKTMEDLLPPGAEPGTMPTDLEQATGLERLEILGKMEGIDIFDMRPLDSSRKGTLDDPIIVKSFGDEQYLGCTGYPADTHVVTWLTVSRERPLERCPECGGVYSMEYVGPQDDGHGHHDDHGHDHHGYEEPKTIADFVKPEYRWR